MAGAATDLAIYADDYQCPGRVTDAATPEVCDSDRGAQFDPSPAAAGANLPPAPSGGFVSHNPPRGRKQFWGEGRKAGSLPVPGLTRFEQLAAKLGVPESEWKQSPALRAFARRYAERFFVPEKLLAFWGIAIRGDCLWHASEDE
jgi:hypothetical protein